MSSSLNPGKPDSTPDRRAESARATYRAVSHNSANRNAEAMVWRIGALRFDSDVVHTGKGTP